ncbi:MAG: sulfatase-like hydrolase/transferase [Candidatus Lokiarchaeota archaeon]|nr:sulfatase-like hydrolase/transferase [Candidatus Lokiarchaeota archaeon]MBD3337462.1 sulfatase-like hydrolase/transferase [Candidatus Lokiarchaeota archaeon]
MSEDMNVLFIITDGQRADHLGCSGNPDLKTPNIDRLAADGVRFTNAYCTNPFCMPNRSSIFTGKYPSVHGVRCNGINLNPQISTFIETLNNLGYYTYSAGKIHLNWQGSPYSRKSDSAEMIIPYLFEGKKEKKPIPQPYYGLEEIDLTLGHGDAVAGHYLNWIKNEAPDYYDLVKSRVLKLSEHICSDSLLPINLHPTNYIVDRTLSFLNGFSKGSYNKKSFFLLCSFPDPHHPVCLPEPYNHMYDPNDIEIPSTLNDIKTLQNHKVLKNYLDVYRMNWLRVTNEEEIRKFIAYTYGSIAMIDAGIGEILEALHSQGLENNTIIVFTSDHGDLMGDHGLLFQGPAHFQGYVKIPMIWKVPDISTPGTITNSLASSVDIPRTILSLLKVKSKYHPSGMQGYDLTPILQNPGVKIRDNCIIEEDEDSQKDSYKLPDLRVRTMVTENYRISIYQGFENYGDFFDLKNDPLELNNLWFDENSKHLKNDLLKKFLYELMILQDRLPKKGARV